MLKAIAEQKTLTTRYIELLYHKEDTRSGDEIAADIINRFGLKFKES